jgi:outer membrane protein TolC
MDAAFKFMKKAFWLSCLCGAWVSLEAAPSYVDLRTVLKLAGARHDEVEWARLQHAQALFESHQAWQRYWPTLTLGAQYRGHEGRLQDIRGDVFDARKHQYSLGPAIVLDWAPGDIHYAALAARQRATAAEHWIEKTRLDLIRQAVERYFDLLAAEAGLTVIANDVAISKEYARQLENAVKVGTAFRADLLRVNTQLARLRLQVRQGEEDLQLAAARLAEVLRLPADADLRAAKIDLIPIRMIGDQQVGELVARAQSTRPEVKAVEANRAALASEETRTRLAPFYPSLQAGYATAGFGGGIGDRSGNFGGQQDFFVGLGWKVGPGGMFDFTRQRLAASRTEAAGLQASRARAAVGREVVEAAVRSRSASEQLAIADQAVSAGEEMTRLAGERQASEVGVVLEYVMAREDLTRARLGRVRAVVDFNRAQYALKMAVGISAVPDAAARTGVHLRSAAPGVR